MQPDTQRRSHSILVIIAVGFGLWWAHAVPLRAAEVELTQAQRTLLELQLNDAYKCELLDIVFLRELEVGGKASLEGRIRCRDQREVDITQTAPNQKFELRLCLPTVC